MCLWCETVFLSLYWDMLESCVVPGFKSFFTIKRCHLINVPKCSSCSNSCFLPRSHHINITDDYLSELSCNDSHLYNIVAELISWYLVKNITIFVAQSLYLWSASEDILKYQDCNIHKRLLNHRLLFFTTTLPYNSKSWTFYMAVFLFYHINYLTYLQTFRSFLLFCLAVLACCVTQNLNCYILSF